MKKIAYAALATTAALALAACGSSDKASEGATAENVEMPAEEAMSGVDATAAPAADAAAAAGAEASGAASDAAAAPPPLPAQLLKLRPARLKRRCDRAAAEQEYGCSAADRPHSPLTA